MGKYHFSIRVMIALILLIELLVGFNILTFMIFLLVAAACYRNWPVAKYPSWDIWWKDRRNWFK